MIKNYLFPLMTLMLIFWGCSSENTEQILRKKTEKYFEAWNKQDFQNPDFTDFKRDTSLTWHGTKEGEGRPSIFNPNSGWKQWDVAWNGTYTFDILEIDADSLKVVGKFRETTDFLKFIGMPEGFGATLTFWFDEQYKVKETLYGWHEDNRDMHEVIKPIVDWAKEHDSLRIQKIYLQDGFVPNRENAQEWKALFDLYKKAKV